MPVAIGEIADIQIGYQPREEIKASPSGTHYLIQARDIQEDLAHDLKPSGVVRFTPARVSEPYTVRRGDVLFLARGSRRSATVIEDLPMAGPVIALYHFFIVRPNSCLVDAHFLSWLINEGPARDHLARVAGGTTIPFVTKQAFTALQVELPAMEVQEEVSRLYRLSMREAQLARQFEVKRLEIAAFACRRLALRGNEL